ncbi:N-acetylglucosamine kinase [Fulvivirga sedimenti]|uniref:N-acetylglucosamine kinase n=1 Tax=Fulvivirga sedimenti TaxID=2879465 RepID=A0A9X1HLS6_9BACT|nr:N-acetylglucosamine kinase [Fulvivirga sedimenti]MCA6074355.1 N-acetylglucosamine kinase [Fulvivirga sedimenti]
MILIADSGSSKTAWRLRGPDGEISQYLTDGLNPVHKDVEALASILKDQLVRDLPVEEALIQEVYFYGAGCVPGLPSERLAGVLKNLFPEAHVEVSDDLLAVARGVCGHEAGIACILGTGTNSCFYDGQEIASKVPALGYILGDEGGGAWLGKELLAAYLRKELPAGIHDAFVKRFNLDRSQIIDKVYSGGNAAFYLAGFSKFIFHHREDPFLYKLVYRGFSIFLEKNVKRYENFEKYPVHFSGSVGFYYSTILRKAASDHGVFVKNIVEGPIAGLTLYHQK